MLILILAGIALILLVTGRFTIDNARFSGAVTANIQQTPIVKNATPIAPYGPLDPAIIAALQGTPGNRPLAVLPSVQPIGVYIPGIPTQTPTPTSTYTMLPTPTASETQTPTATLTSTIPPPTPVQTLTGTRTPLPPTPKPTKPATPKPTKLASPKPTIPPTATNNAPPNPAPAGENCAPHGLPVNGVLTQRFHYYHSGVDLGVPIRTPVLATHSGQVIFAGWSFAGYGWLVIIQNGHYITYYAHNASLNVSSQQYVKTGDVISYSGSTGNSSGPHLHYETRIDDVPADPLTFDQRGLPTC